MFFADSSLFGDDPYGIGMWVLLIVLAVLLVILRKQGRRRR